MKKRIESLLFHPEYNLDKKNTIELLPSAQAIYAIFGTRNGLPVNCRYVGTASDLKQAVLSHFKDDVAYHCLNVFLKSIKIKMIIYEMIEGTHEDLVRKKTEWEAEFKPDCNEKLNEVF